jgi:hypothetical protein
MHRLPNQQKNPKRRRSYTVGKKRTVVQHFKLSRNVSATSSMLNVNRKSLALWVKQSEALDTLPLNLRKIYDKNKAKRALFADKESELAEWITSRRAEHIQINAYNVSNKMLELIQAIPETSKTQEMKDFVASRGWFERFMKRNNLVQRRVTGVGKGFPTNLKEIIENFLDEFHRIRLEKNYTDDQVWNFDESAFYMDSLGNYTIEKKGSKRAYCKSTGKERVRMSCLMCASSTGVQLPVLAIIPRKTEIPGIVFPQNIHEVYETKGRLCISNRLYGN